MTVAYRRASEVLWRDTGDVVLALAPGGGEEVQVLSGGSALLWRCLASPARAVELARRLNSNDQATDGSRVEPDMLLPVLEDLLQRGLLSEVRAEP